MSRIITPQTLSPSRVLSNPQSSIQWHFPNQPGCSWFYHLLLFILPDIPLHFFLSHLIFKTISGFAKLGQLRSDYIQPRSSLWGFLGPQSKPMFPHIFTAKDLTLPDPGGQAVTLPSFEAQSKQAGPWLHITMKHASGSAHAKQLSSNSRKLSQPQEYSLQPCPTTGSKQ